MQTKLPTVTVAVSAYNEEQNILNFINSVLTQREEGFVLENILIISDGSNDNTVTFARSLNLRKIRVLAYKNRKGKSVRLNHIYKCLKTDILIQSDSDVILGNHYVIRDMVKTLIRDKKTVMCGGNPIPVTATTFIERAINHAAELYIAFRKNVRKGNNIFSADGRILGYKKELIKQIIIPATMIANDMYTYFCCLSLGYNYKYVSTATVYYRSPQTLRDHISQNSRFRAAPIRLKKYFSAALVNKELSIPFSLFTISAARHFIKNPFLSVVIFSINLYTKVNAFALESRMIAKWDVAYSTKQI